VVVAVGLKVEAVDKNFNAMRALVGVHVEAHAGEFLTFLGPSGCGKTTLLRAIAGFVTPDAGRILVGGQDVTHTPPNRRNFGFVFQSYALFPHMNVADNVGYGLRLRKVAADRIGRTVSEMLDLVNLSHLAKRYPKELSGGQQQRVAMARALAINPAVLLLDEPLSNLDAKLREHIRIELRDLQKRIGITTIFVTHDQEEAMAVSDRIVVMNAGRVEQIGTPEEIYDRPASRFVAEFVGTNNVLPASSARGALCLRPERIALSRATHAGGIEARIETAEFLGPTARYVVVLPDGTRLKVLGMTTADRLQAGDGAWVSWDAVSAYALPEVG
jgi:ABC-type Fe3+/spermidine/putrescine transport system ATPase subunit